MTDEDIERIGIEASVLEPDRMPSGREIVIASDASSREIKAFGRAVERAALEAAAQALSDAGHGDAYEVIYRMIGEKG